MNWKSFKLSIPTLALGLALGFAAGHGLNSQAEPTEKPRASFAESIDLYDSELFNPFDDFVRWHNFSMPKLSMSKFSMPKIESKLIGNEVKITAEVPGVEEKDLELTVTDDFLTIKGRKAVASEAKEKSFGEFQRSMSLPCRIESDKAIANLKNGVLTITAPRNQVAKAEGRKLEIQTQ
jgi:HSP20 family protein